MLVAASRNCSDEAVARVPLRPPSCCVAYSLRDELKGTKPTPKPNSRPILSSVASVGFAEPASISATWRLVSESVLAKSSWVMPKPLRMSATAPAALDRRYAHARRAFGGSEGSHLLPVFSAEPFSCPPTLLACFQNMVGIALQRPIACSRRSEDKTIEIVVDD